MAHTKKKKKPKKLSTPIAGQSPDQGSKKGSVASQIFQPRVLSTFAFGLGGLLAGIATGLNHFPSLGQTAAIPKMMLLAAYLGDPHLDTQMGITTGFSGLVVGACLGFSALSEPKDMFLSLILSVALATLAVTFTGSVGLVGVAFLLGHAPVIAAYRKLRTGA